MYTLVFPASTPPNALPAGVHIDSENAFEALHPNHRDVRGRWRLCVVLAAQTEAPGPPPKPGEHTEEILEWLDCSSSL
jgi:hypothetical protein